MKKSSLKLYFATFLFTITLASFTYAGDTQCPLVPPPPGTGGRAAMVNTKDVITDSFKYIKDFLGFWIRF
jgi:hypothetical protein